MVCCLHINLMDFNKKCNTIIKWSIKPDLAQCRQLDSMDNTSLMKNCISSVMVFAYLNGYALHIHVYTNIYMYYKPASLGFFEGNIS